VADERDLPGEPASSTFSVDEVLRPELRRRLGALPRLVLVALRLTWRAARAELVISGALQLVAGIAVGGQLLAGRSLLGHVVRGRVPGGFADALPALASFTLATALVSFANLARNEHQRLLTELTARHAMGQVLTVAGAVELVEYDKPAFHDRLQRAQLNAQARPAQMASGVLGLLSAAFAIVGIGGALLVMQPEFLVLVLVGYLPAWVATNRASRLGYRFALAQTERDRRRSYLAMVLTGKDEAKEIRSFGLSGYLRDRYDRLYDEFVVDLRKLISHRLRLGLAGGLVTSMLSAGTVAVLVWFVSTGRTPVAAAAAAAGGVMLIGQRLQAFAGAAGLLYESSLFLEDFSSFVDIAPELAAARPTGTPPPRFRRLAVNDVWFQYPSAKSPCLRGVSLDIEAGQVVAVVGENGSGKTTLAKILAGLYSPQRGCVTWDGMDVAGADPELVRDAVAVMFQDFMRYQLTAHENVTLGRASRAADDVAVRRAAERAQANAFLERLPRGYATQLGPQFFGGTDLSSGQWQRLALARAYFRDAPFVILDEPTAALDPRAEFELFDKIRELCEGRAVLMISHRFSSVRSADCVYVLHHGEVVESGPHDDLMAYGGRYAELFTLQASAYLEADA
jgi:ATP-binding cassette subfamily B protein